MGISSAVVVNATFIISGMLGLQLKFLDHGNVTTVSTSVPVTSAPDGVIPVSPSALRTPKLLKTERYGCGNKNCNSSELCVNWQKIDDGKNSVKECMIADGRYSTIANHNLTKLCKRGETHSLLKSEPQKCRKDNPPSCDIVWKYRCVKENESPHSCNLKRCPNDYMCLELIHCDRDLRPCITMAECHHVSRG